MFLPTQSWSVCPPSRLIPGPSQPEAFPGCQVEDRTPPPMSGLLLQRVICHHCFHLDSEKSRQLGKIWIHKGIQKIQKHRSPFMYQYYWPTRDFESQIQKYIRARFHSCLVVLEQRSLGFLLDSPNGIWYFNNVFLSSHKKQKKSNKCNDSHWRVLRSMLPSSGSMQ